MSDMKLDKSYLLLKNWWGAMDLTNFEKNLLNKNIVTFNQQLFRLKEKKLRIGVFGKAGVGKSSILNSILNENFFNTGILNGSTRKIKIKEWNSNQFISNKIDLVDTPGFDICSLADKQVELINILELDLILFVVSGDLNRNEVKAMNLLINNGKKIIIIFNKVDIWQCSDIENIVTNIKLKLPKDISIPVIFNSNKYDNNKDINNDLNTYLINIINKIGDSLLIFNTFKLADKLISQIKQNRLIKRRKDAQSLIGKFATMKASSVALNPIFCFDIAGSFAFDTFLIKELSKVYGFQIKSQSAINIFKTISINNIFLGFTQIGINTLFNIVKKISLLAAPFTNGISLLPYGPVAITQAGLAVISTKIIGKLAAKEILKKNKINDLEPFKIIQKIALEEPDIIDSVKISSYNQENNDLSLFLP